MKNQVLRANQQPSLIYQQHRKLMWLSLPDLKPITKYYTKSNFIQTMGQGSILIIDKNCISFITVTLPQLGLGLFKQDFFDWQPKGGLCLSQTVILYNDHTINFYQRGTNLKKTWTIQVMQQIKLIKSSPEQKVIGMTVTQKKNTVFLWDLHDISNKPFQQIEVSEPIVKWQFHTQDMLAILTPRQFQVYYPKDGQYSLQFFVQMAHIAIDFCFFDRPKVNQHSGRRSVYPVSILSPGGKLFVYELYDIDKRVKNSIANIIATLEIEENTAFILCGYENQNSEIILSAQTLTGKPFSLLLSSKYVIKKKWQYLPQLNTQNPNKIQYCKQIICTQDETNPKQQSMGESKKIYKLYKLKGKDKFELITQIECQNYGILGGYHFFSFEIDKLIVYSKAHDFKDQLKVVINEVKVGDVHLLEERENIVYFVSGIKIYRLDLINKMYKVHGFVVKNQRFKLIQVRNQTRSLLYKSADQYLLFEYQTPQKPANESEKVVIRTIKSSPYPVISLRNERWVEKRPQKIIIGESNKVLVEFDLAKFFKLLTLENMLIDYQIYWTTHDGIILFIKNYLFFLELTQSSDGYSVNIIKRSLNYLHSRFDPDVEGVQIMDARNIVVREGCRIIKLGSKIGNFVSEDPYSVPDTLLRRQLLMRKMYPPHHPKIIQFLIQMGYFDLLDTIFKLVWEWLKQNSGLIGIYKKIGAQFFIANKDAVIKTIAISQQQTPILKQLCEKILESPHELLLDQNFSLILQSQIQSIIYREENQRALDFYSSIVITQFKTFQTKNESLKMMHVAFLVHSINKQEAISILRQQKTEMDWDWMKKYSIVMWYDGKNQIKSWTEEIGTNLFKVNKEPLDCLFWYTVAGKKNVLIQLFKKYIYNSAEHEKIFKFLQRDFSDTKTQNAAVNNAYALVDKKRYMHALAFFIYGQKIDEAISVCLSKLKDINLAFLMCNLMDDNTNRNKLIDMMLKEGDVWAKHIGYFYKNQHIDSFNCLFEQDDIQVTAHWSYQPKLSNFHPCLKQFALNIQKSIPVKRELQQQQLKRSKPQQTDIFQSFYGKQQQQTTNIETFEQKQLISDYNKIQKQSIAFFTRNSCPILALMLQPTNRKAKRAYDLCKFMLTKEVNETVMELIEDMEDYSSIVDAEIHNQPALRPVLAQYLTKFEKVINQFTPSSIVKNEKYVIGELMHYAYLTEVIVEKLLQNHIQNENGDIKKLQTLSEIAKLLLIQELEAYELFQNFSQQFINLVIEPEKSEQHMPKILQFWQTLKSHYDSMAEQKKNKKQNLYDIFEQSLYKYTFKKGQFINQTTNFKADIQKCTPIFIKKIILDLVSSLASDKIGDATAMINRLRKQLTLILLKWADDKVQEQLQKQFLTMLSEGVVSKLKLNFLPNYLNENFQPLCRGLLLLRSKYKKPYPQPSSLSSLGLSSTNSKPQKTECIQLFRNRIESIKQIAINKNQGKGMQIALLTKRGVKKFQVCDSLINKNRSQDGSSLIHQDNMQYQYGSNNSDQFQFNNLFQHGYLPLVDRFVRGVMENRKQYDGFGVIKGSAKRWTPQYLKVLDPAPIFDMAEVNCIQCHHFLPIYMLGGKSTIELCNFSTNANYNRIKCQGMGDIVKVRSYQQRVTALDNAGNLSSFSYDAKISGACVYSLKKASVIDFCQMTPTTYGICTQNSIQVIDSLLHPKRQTVFKVSTNQAPLCLDYFSQTKLSICRKTDMLIYDTRMDILQESRDLQGKVKCMATNYKNRLLVGKTDNKVRVVDANGVGAESDYDVKVSGKGGEGDKLGVQDIQIMGKFVVVLNGEGIVSMFSIGE